MWPLNPRSEHLLVGYTTLIMLVMVMVMQNISAKPQDPAIFEDIAIKGLSIAGNAAEMVGNAGMFSKQMGFEAPFGKGNSATQIGMGAAMRNDDDDSSEEDRRRRKRDNHGLQLNYNDDLLGKEFLLALPHFHRGKRSPCNFGTGTGGDNGNIEDGGDYVDLAERRRRAYARKRKAAAGKKANTARKTNRKTDNGRRNKSLVNDDVQQTLARRKRQSELDDLNPNIIGKDFSQHAQQITDKIRNVLQTFMNSMNDMGQILKQHFKGQSSTPTEEI